MEKEHFFFYCSKLENVSFGNESKLTTINNSAFQCCDELKSILIPSSVKSIGKAAFYFCSKLENVSFEKESKLTTINNSAFDSCEKLKSISIPPSVESIGKAAF